MPKKLYISSTYSDLEPYRKVIIDNIRFLSDRFDLTRVMEYMKPPVQDSIVDECLKDVADCDIYVLLIGKRYGSIEPRSKVSYTENEYRVADNLNKIIIPLIADDHADLLSDIETDNLSEYNRFKNDVRNKHLTYVKGFTNPYHLYSQLLQSLYSFLDEKDKWVIGDSLKYYCDRSMQREEFLGMKKKNKLNVFTIVGKEYDRPDCFSMRMGKYEFGLQKEFVETPLRSSNFIGNISRYEKHRMILIGHMMKNFLDSLDDRPETIEECFAYFKKNNHNNIFITLYLTRPDIQNDLLKKTLSSFFSELNKGCQENNVTIYYVVVFQFENTENVDDRIADWVLQDENMIKTGAKLSEIEPLPLIKLQDLNDWMQEHALKKFMSDNESSKTDSLLSGYFQNPDKSEDMNKTLELIEKIITIINEKK